MISHTTDFENRLSSVLETLFPNIRHIGCFNDYSNNIRKNIKERIIKNLYKYNCIEEKKDKTLIINDNI